MVSNDELFREHAAETLSYLVTGTYVHNVFGFEIEVIEERIAERTMVGWDSDLLGPWLPEWQFVVPDDGAETLVSPLALELWKAWGDCNPARFVEVMATHTMDNVPKIGDESTYAQMVQLGLNPLEDYDARSYFQSHGLGGG